MSGYKHLVWIIYASLLGFLVPFLFENAGTVPLDWYYLLYFVFVSVFFCIYIRTTSFEYKKWFSHRFVLGIGLGLITAAFLALNVYSRPETYQLEGSILLWNLFWRGLVYGVIDALLMSVIPWVVTWRAFSVSDRPFFQKLGFSVLALVFVLIVTASYHTGYEDFRSPKIIQPLIGNTIITLPTLISGNPVASVVAHAGIHIAAVLYSPGTDVYLPPHR